MYFLIYFFHILLQFTYAVLSIWDILYILIEKTQII